ncbi:MAG: hypothetical protein HPKKFMNG_01992 [Planctomycetes bacterium]|nr:hypothetical protein [Planctomycetota bacterium]HRJ77583.1 hypothetical protein [Planctomycetota bacterium]
MGKSAPREKPTQSPAKSDLMADLSQVQLQAQSEMERAMKETHRVLKQAIDRAGPKRVARALDISLSLVYKWTQPARTKQNPAASGARNPLDKLLAIFELSQDLELVHFICQMARGYYTPNPLAKGSDRISFVSETVSSLNDFADMLQYAEKSLTNDGRIDEAEAAKLRQQWNRLKGRLEHFIISCEEGHFNAGSEDSDDAEEE